MKPIIIPETHNYVAAFLTMACNYRCSYCINYFRDGELSKNHMKGEEWIEGLNRIVSSGDLPVTLQGGEPSIHKDFICIINNLKPELVIDILTNLQFDVEEFISKVDPKRVNRDAPYASIRVSYHPEVMDLEETIQKVFRMQDAGFKIGIWGVTHPSQEDVILEAQDKCKKKGIDFRTKEFLGEYNGELYGSFKYEGACSGEFKKNVYCKTTELIIGPGGDIYRCHSDLYGDRAPVGHLLDPEFEIEDKFRECDCFGYCNPCDLKYPKFNRFQQPGHCSVEVKQCDFN